MSKLKVILIIFFLFPSKSFALTKINPLTGELLIKIMSNDFLKKIDASYYSHSTFKGILGTGWCTRLDSRLVFKDNKIEHFNCENKTTFTSSFNNSYKNKNGFKITILNGVFILKTKLGIMVFNRQGNLLSYQNKKLRFILKKKTLMLLTNEGLYRYKLDFFKGKLSKATSKRENFLFLYSSDEQLTHIYINDELNIKLKYNDFLNLTSLIHEKQRIILKYNNYEDTITEIQTNNCILKTQQLIRKKSTSVTKKCGHQTSVYTYYYQKNSLKSLSSISITNTTYSIRLLLTQSGKIKITSMSRHKQNINKEELVRTLTTHTNPNQYINYL